MYACITDTTGGLDMAGTRIVMPNGSIDPWHALSILESNPGIVAIYINGTAHWYVSNCLSPSSYQRQHVSTSSHRPRGAQAGTLHYPIAVGVLDGHRL